MVIISYQGIYDGQNFESANTKISKDAVIPSGWRKGRVLSV